MRLSIFDLSRTNFRRAILTSVFFGYAVQQSSFALAADCNTQYQPRLRIELFKYAQIIGNNTGLYDVFADALVHAINQYAEQSHENEKLDYVSSLKIDEVTDISSPNEPAKYSFGSADQQQKHWESELDLLAMLHGSISLDSASGKISAASNVYVGSLGDAINQREVEVSLATEVGAIDSLRENHTMLISYLLAMDAEKRKCPLSLQVDLLSDTRLRALTFERQVGPSTTEQKIMAKVTQKLDEIRRNNVSLSSVDGQ